MDFIIKDVVNWLRDMVVQVTWNPLGWTYFLKWPLNLESKEYILEKCLRKNILKKNEIALKRKLRKLQ